MFFVLACSLFSCAGAAMLALYNGYFGMATFVALTAAMYLFLCTTLRSAVACRGFAVALLALGIGALYSSLYLWVFGYEFYLVSDAALYDAVARDIAETVPWYTQINPLSYEYVGQLGNHYGEINHPGYFKILGIGYTIGAALGMEAISLQIPLALNLASFSLVGFVLHKILENTELPSRASWTLMLVFMTTPFLLELLVWIRKDLFLLMLSLFAVYLIQKRYNPLCIFAFVALVATVRVPQAVWLTVLFVVHLALLRGWRPAKVLARHRVLVALCTFVLLFAAVAYLPELNVAPESFAALLEGQREASIGFSRYLTTNILGAALYGVLYPFPSLAPQDLKALCNTLYAYVHLGLISAVFLIVPRKKKNWSPFMAALWISLLVTLAGYALVAMMSWKHLGFVVFESRFKLFGMALAVILFGTVWQDRHHYQYRRRMGGRLPTQCSLIPTRSLASRPRVRVIPFRGCARR